MQNSILFSTVFNQKWFEKKTDSEIKLNDMNFIIEKYKKCDSRLSLADTEGRKFNSLRLLSCVLMAWQIISGA